MELLSIALGTFTLVLGGNLLLRAIRSKILAQFPLFYSYICFSLATTLINYTIYYFILESYPNTFWFCATVLLMAEFAVILEGSDHIFRPYPPLRRLGRLLTTCICTAFFLVYILPPLMQQRSARVAIFELVKRASLTKAVLIVILLAGAHLYGLPLGKNIAGMMLGFATYLSLNITNIVLAESYPPSVYGRIFAVVGPFSYVLALAIWNIAFWRYEPASPRGREFYRRAENTSEPLAEQLGRHRSELARLFRR